MSGHDDITTKGNKVFVPRNLVTRFNSTWPCSKLRDSRSYWFEFDNTGDLVDTDVPQQDDGPEASAMADDCLAYLRDGVEAEWMK